MPLPIKQYKHMFKDVKFLATTAQPSYREVSHWIDLLEDPTGGTIKVWNGTGWKKISGEGDSDTGLVIGDTTGTAAYQGYFHSETIISNDSSTVKVTPLPDELIYIQSSRSTLTNINVDSIYNFRLIIGTGDQSVMLDVDGLTGVIGTTFTGSKIALEANSSYEIDVANNTAVVAKINKPQAM